MIFTDDIPHNTGGFLVRLVPVIAQLLHGVQHPTVNGLKPVPHIRQGPADNDAHGVLEIGLFHLLLDAGQIGFFLDHLMFNSDNCFFFCFAGSTMVWKLEKYISDRVRNRVAIKGP